MNVIGPSETWGAWHVDPGLIVLLGAAAFAYGLGVRRLWSAGRGRGLSRRRVACFYLGLLALVAALMSPVDALGAYLFSAHMTQHLLLVLVVAPLLVFGEPVEAMMVALPVPTRRSVRRLARTRVLRSLGRLVMSPLVVAILSAGVLWAWHVPAFYRAALNSEPLHVLEHSSFLLTSMMVWALVIAAPRRRRLDQGTAIIVVVAQLLQSTVLSAVLVFAGSVLYPFNALGARAWGLSPAEDQQLAGVIMWVPMGTVYLVTSAVLFLRWMRSFEARFPNEPAEMADA